MRSFCSCYQSQLRINSFEFLCCIALAFEAGDKTDRIIAAAKARAHAALKEKSPKLTALEKGMWESMLRGGRPVRHQRPSR